ncbi:MAG: hypothetical protein AB7E70_00485 [Hyphomicrobiaceae bacterium]
MNFVGAGVASVAASLDIDVPPGSFGSGFELMRRLAQASPGDVASLVQRVTEDIVKSWPHQQIPFAVVANVLEALPEVMDAHRPSSSTIVGALAASRGLKHASASVSGEQVSQKVASDIVLKARQARTFATNGLSEPLAFFLLDCLYLHVLSDRKFFYRNRRLLEEHFAALGTGQGVQPAAPPQRDRLAGIDLPGLAEAHAVPAELLEKAAAALAETPCAETAIVPKLVEKARDFKELLAQIREEIGGSAGAVKLREQAAEMLAMCDLAEADRLLGRAEVQDLTGAGDGTPMPVRQRSASHTRTLRGRIEELVCHYRLAAAHYAVAVRCLPANDREARWLGLMRQARALVRQSEEIGDTAALEEATQIYGEAALQQPRAVAPKQWAATELSRANALLMLGRQLADPERIKQSLRHFTGVLEICTMAEAPEDWAMANLNLAEALRQLSDLTGRHDLLEQAATSLRAAMKAFDRGARPYEWATTRSRLGDVLWARGLALADPQLVAEAIDAKTAALDELDALDRQDEAALLRGELERMQHDAERLTPVEPPDQAESA